MLVISVLIGSDIDLIMIKTNIYSKCEEKNTLVWSKASAWHSHPHYDIVLYHYNFETSPSQENSCTRGWQPHPLPRRIFVPGGWGKASPIKTDVGK